MQQWRIVSFSSWLRWVTPSIRWRQLIWKTSSFVKSVAKSIQHSEAYNKVVMTTSSSSSLSLNLCCVRSGAMLDKHNHKWHHQMQFSSSKYLQIHLCLGTNLIHDFTAVTFSVKLAFFREKRRFP